MMLHRRAAPLLLGAVATCLLLLAAFWPGAVAQELPNTVFSIGNDGRATFVLICSTYSMPLEINSPRGVKSKGMITIEGEVYTLSYDRIKVSEHVARNGLQHAVTYSVEQGPGASVYLHFSRRTPPGRALTQRMEPPPQYKDGHPAHACHLTTCTRHDSCCP
jgi:hypothetical protein